MNWLAQTGILQNGTLNFKMGIDEILISKLSGFDFFDRFWQLLQTRWNFTLYRAISAGKKSVSIPNEMEFYAAFSFSSASTLACFNPQRDGILRHRGASMCLEKQRFQFPTGWNSTLLDVTPKIWILVSIPNGMEFYADRYPPSYPEPKVSIPNGMEFY